MITQEKKILDIVQDFLIKNDVRVSVSIEQTEFDGYNIFKAKLDSSKKNEFKYKILYNLDYWENKMKPSYRDKHPIYYAKDIVSTMLHEATHIICHHRGIESSDKSPSFEKMLYDNYLNSNDDNPDGRFISSVIGIDVETYRDYYKNKREDLFFTKYIDYVNYLLGYSNSIEGNISGYINSTKNN